jgi:hypothetical protein
MRASGSRALYLLALFSLACDGPMEPVDAGPPDSSTSDPDAGTPRDAGSDPDSGPPDSGPPPTECNLDNTLGNLCSFDSQCDDGCFCNGVERCFEGTCEAARGNPCNDRIDCTADSCTEEAHCTRVADDSVCNDTDDCTLDFCDLAIGCDYTVRDFDGDGFTDGYCGGDDCDDTLIDVHPEASEVCDNWVDDDCNGLRDVAEDSCTPTNDTCATADIIPAETRSYAVSTRGMRFDYGLSCNSGGGGFTPDAVFQITIPDDELNGRDLRVQVGGGGPFESSSVVAIRRMDQCEDGPDVRCSGMGNVLARSLAPGDYAIIVQSSSTARAMNMHVTVSDPTEIPPVDVCDAGTEVIRESGTFRGRWEDTSDNYTVTCSMAGMGGGSDGPADISITEDSGAAVALVTDCSNTTTTRRCVSSASFESLRVRNLEAGTYYILVEPPPWTSTVEWALRVTITRPPMPRRMGDWCDEPIEVALAGVPPDETGTGTGMLAADMELDGSNTCTGMRGDPSARDVYYHFTLTETRDVTLGFADLGFASYTYALWNGTCGSLAELRCRSLFGETTDRILSLPAGEYFVTIASSSIVSPELTVTTSTPTPVPANDRCDGAIDISTMMSAGTLVDAGDDTLACGDFGMVDIFYSFVVSEPSFVFVAANTTEGAGTLAVSIRDSCSASSTIACGTDPGGSAGVSAELEARAEPYIVVVEMNAASARPIAIRAVMVPR